MPRHRYDSESNYESTQNQTLFAWVMSWVESKMGKHFESWSQSESIPGESTWVMSLFWVNYWKAAWVLSWIDSSLRDSAWVISWFESRHLSRMPKKGHTNATLEWEVEKGQSLMKAQKMSSKLSESPKKWTKTTADSNNWVMTWFASIFIIFYSWVDLNQNLIFL